MTFQYTLKALELMLSDTSFDSAACEALMYQLIREDEPQFIQYLTKTVSSGTNFLLTANILKVLGKVTCSDWADEIFTNAISHSDLDVRDAAARSLDIHGRLDILKANQEQIPWMRDYIETILLNSIDN